MRASLLLGFLALLPAVSHADYCAERAQAALDELGQVAASAPQAGNDTQPRAVLEQLCRDAQAAALAGNPAPEAKEPESTKILGVEIREAPKGAAGYQRASKGP